MSRARLVRAVLALAWLALAAVAVAADAPPPGAAAPAGNPAGADPAAKQDQQPTITDDRNALDASEKWLALIDTGKPGAAWDVSAKLLQTAVTRANWVKGIGEARKPFGKVASRSRERFARTHQIPGAPDGDYALIEFAASFANGKRAVEQITWMLEPDGVWRVSGYYIR